MTNDSQIFEAEFASQLSLLIGRRRTTKVLARSGHSVTHTKSTVDRCNQIVREAIADAGFAPFHFNRNLNSIAEPWRFHVLWQDECRQVGRKLGLWFSDIKPGNKLPAMLAACGCLVLVNWLPQFDVDEAAEKQLQINEEHLAAAAAATQTLLLKLTACNLKTYWSSGGCFRTREMFERLAISSREKMLAAVFVDYGADLDHVELIPGNLATARSDYRTWTREITANDILDRTSTHGLSE